MQPRDVTLYNNGNLWVKGFSTFLGKPYTFWLFFNHDYAADTNVSLIKLTFLTSQGIPISDLQCKHCLSGQGFLPDSLKFSISSPFAYFNQPTNPGFSVLGDSICFILYSRWHCCQKALASLLLSITDLHIHTKVSDDFLEDIFSC